MFRRLPLAARAAPLLAAALALLGGCGSADERADAPVRVSAIGTGLDRADPALGPIDAPRRALLGATAQGLVRFDAASQIEPGLAERWIVIDEGRSYIFRLRPAIWPDGSSVTTAEVARELRRAAAPGSRNPLAPFLAVIDEVVPMTPEVIEVRLKHPRPDLLKLFAQPELALFRPRDAGGTGPFRMAPVRAGARGPLLLRADSALAGGDEDGVPRGPAPVQLRADRAALAIARFIDGSADVVLGGSFVDWPILMAARPDAERIRLDPAIGMFGLAVVRREGFLADPDNRAAVAMAIDRVALTAAFGPDWAPSEALLPAQLDSAAPPARPSWTALDLATRRATAAARVTAWVAATGESPQLRIALPDGPGATLLWGQVAGALRRIGVLARRVALDAPADLRLVDLVAPYDSGRWFVQTACAPCAPEAADRVAAGRDAGSLADRAQRIAEADAALAADVAFIPLAQPLRWSLVAPGLDGWQRNVRAWHPLDHLRSEAE